MHRPHLMLFNQGAHATSSKFTNKSQYTTNFKSANFEPINQNYQPFRPARGRGRFRGRGHYGGSHYGGPRNKN